MQPSSSISAQFHMVKVTLMEWNLSPACRHGLFQSYKRKENQKLEAWTMPLQNTQALHTWRWLYVSFFPSDWFGKWLLQRFLKNFRSASLVGFNLLFVLATSKFCIVEGNKHTCYWPVFWVLPITPLKLTLFTI